MKEVKLDILAAKSRLRPMAKVLCVKLPTADPNNKRWSGSSTTHKVWIGTGQETRAHACEMIWPL